MRQQTKARPDDGQQTLIRQRTVMREEYAETTERGFGLLHAIVIAQFDHTPTSPMIYGNTAEIKSL